MRIRKYLAALVAAPAAFLLVTSMSGAAFAATLLPTQYSSNLAGYVVASPQRLVDVHSAPQNLPDPGIPTPDQIAVGDVLAQTSSGGEEVGLGFVWTGNTTSACPAGTWDLMYGAGDETGLFPLSLSELTSQVFLGGNPVCDAPGQSAYIALYQSTRHGLVNVTYGPTEAEASVVEQFTPAYGGGSPDPQFFSAGIGVDTTSAAGAEALQGSVFSFTGPGNGLTILTSPQNGSPQKRITYDTFPLIEVVGTENGSKPTIGNLITLQPSALAVGSAFSVSVPSIT